ncbi:MAG: isoprenylcysteine carboxylmethyltransferase family protein [Clostridia bacterium]|nr:isoprenylcysteine carboxylmethyltransferase family protein [Clostridia bacterium]
MNGKLFFTAVTKFLLGAAVVSLILFVSAGTLNYPNAWLLIGILFVPMFAAGLFLMFKNPELLSKRLDAKEKEKEQQSVVKLSGLMFVLGFAAAGIDFRFKIIVLPKVFVIAGAILFSVSYAMYAEVLRENTYLSRTIGVSEDQKVIDSGLYGIVRHPMYFATLGLFLSMPIVLGSVLSFVIFLFYPAIIVKRIINEEEVLERELDGYTEYKQKVKYRLLPFVW